jgi:hypothetical protein
MCLFKTLKAIIISALAYYISGFHRWVFNRELAARSRAPLSCLVNINERLLEEIAILFIVGICTAFSKEILGHYNLAAGLRASRVE